MLGWLDYAVVAFSLLLSLGTGVYHAIMSKKILAETKTSAKEEYLMGGRSLPPLPVALSLLTTFLSGILMIAVPAETFQRGLQIWQSFYISIAAAIFTAVVFVPVFHKMKGTCLHEYFIHRYNSLLLRRLFSIIFLFYNFFYLAAVIYAPAVALGPVMQVDKNVIITVKKVDNWQPSQVLGLSTTLYTCIGGMKAVVWTDSLQAIMMYGGVAALLYRGLNNPQVGGFTRVWKLAIDSGRIGELARFDPSPAQYNSFWINIYSAFIKYLSAYAVNQMAMQRYMALPSVKHAQGILYWTILPMLILTSLVTFVGLLVLAYFYNCNPLETGEIAELDHITILFAKTMLLPIPGLFGLYLTCVMSATLSTLSSGMNSMAAAIYEDFLKQKLDRHITDRQAAKLNKTVVVITGVLSTCLAFAGEPLGGMLRMSISVLGALGGPMVGVFVLAFFFPSSGFWGCITSFSVSTVIMVVICILNYFENPYSHENWFLPTNTTEMGCGHGNFSVRPLPPWGDGHYGDPSTTYLARISTWAYPGIGFFIFMTIGILLSIFYKEGKPEKIRYLTFYGRHDPWPKSEHEVDHFLAEPSS